MTMSPPLASNIYVTQAVDGEVTAVDVTRGTLPCYVTVLGLTLLLIIVDGAQRFLADNA